VKALAIFIASGVLAIIAAIVVLSHMMPPGEGSFGMVKLAPLILMVLIPVFFCLIWFPANLAVWLLLTSELKDKASGTKGILAFSGTLFALTLAVSGYFLAPQWFHRVHFYYKLVDQFGQPVSGATIRRHEDFTPTTGDTESENDAQGLFQESCKPGEGFSLNPRKNGYALASLNVTGAYSEELRQKQKQAHAERELILVKMWKLEGAQPLVTVDQHYKLPFTGAPIFSDLIPGKIVSSGGDLEVIVKRAPGSLSKRNPGDWSIEFKPIDGGIIESDDATSRVTYEAPAEGYQNSYLVTMSHENPAWFDNIQKVFFLTSRNGQVHTKLAVDFGINTDPKGSMWLQFKGAANVTGSRNWEGTVPQ
jgi:hypothetical protein